MKKLYPIITLVFIAALSYQGFASSHDEDAFDKDINFSKIIDEEQITCYPTEAHSSLEQAEILSSNISHSDLWNWVIFFAQQQLATAHSIERGQALPAEYAPAAMITAAFMIKWLQHASNDSFQEIIQILSSLASSYSAFLSERLPQPNFILSFTKHAEKVVDEIILATYDYNAESLRQAAQTCILAAADALYLHQEKANSLLAKFEAAFQSAFSSKNSSKFSKFVDNRNDISVELLKKLPLDSQDHYDEESFRAQLSHALLDQLTSADFYKRSAKLGAVTTELLNKGPQFLGEPKDTKLRHILETLGTKSSNKSLFNLGFKATERLIGFYIAYNDYSESTQEIEGAKKNLADYMAIKEHLEILSIQKALFERCPNDSLAHFQAQCPASDAIHSKLSFKYDPASLAASELFNTQGLSQAQLQHNDAGTMLYFDGARLGTALFKTTGAIKFIGILSPYQWAKPFFDNVENITSELGLVLGLTNLFNLIQDVRKAKKIQGVAAYLADTYSNHNTQETPINEVLGAVARSIENAHQSNNYFTALVKDGFKSVRLILVYAISCDLPDRIFARSIDAKDPKTYERTYERARRRAVIFKGITVGALTIINYALPIGSIYLDVEQNMQSQELIQQQTLTLEAIKVGLQMSQSNSLPNDASAPVEYFNAKKQQMLDALPFSQDIQTTYIIDKQQLNQLVTHDLALDYIKNDPSYGFMMLVIFWESNSSLMRDFLKQFNVEEDEINALEQSLSRPQDVVNRLKQIFIL